MSLPTTPLPSYVNLDAKSEWHRSALFSTALESMTLPSRLRLTHSGRETLDQLASALNINGNQNIAKLRMSIHQKPATNGLHRNGRLEVKTESRDARLPSQDGRANEDDVDDEDSKIFDMDFFPTETGEYVGGRQSSKKAHVFGQAENYRIDDDQLQPKKKRDEDEGYERARRRAEGLTITRRYVHHFLMAYSCVSYPIDQARVSCISPSLVFPLCSYAYQTSLQDKT